jgi:hypothetical protein
VYVEEASSLGIIFLVKLGYVQDFKLKFIGLFD